MRRLEEVEQELTQTRAWAKTMEDRAAEAERVANARIAEMLRREVARDVVYATLREARASMTTLEVRGLAADVLLTEDGAVDTAEMRNLTLQHVGDGRGQA